MSTALPPAGRPGGASSRLMLPGFSRAAFGAASAPAAPGVPEPTPTALVAPARAAAPAAASAFGQDMWGDPLAAIRAQAASLAGVSPQATSELGRLRDELAALNALLNQALVSAAAPPAGPAMPFAPRLGPLAVAEAPGALPAAPPPPPPPPPPLPPAPAPLPAPVLAPMPAPVPPPASPLPAPASAPGPAAATYTVQPGDSLSAIAARLLGDPERWRELHDLNRDVVGDDPDLIHPGQTLRLPGGAEVPAAPAPASTEAPSPVPYINQFSPDGKAGGYWNGDANCGPTSMAMIARAFGYGGGMSDAALINHLGAAGGTSGDGTSVGGIGKMAEQAGLACEMRGPGAQVAWMAEQLRAGKLIVANGDYHEMAPHRNPSRTSGHYVAVIGVEPDGTFLVHDPADQAVNRVSQDDMARFINSNPNGGYQMAIGR